MNTDVRTADHQPLLDPEVLRSFVVVAETGSFSKAAREMFRTTSAISMQIKRLEERLGQQLLIRQAKRATLTPAGERLLSHSRQLLRLNEEVVAQFVKPQLSGLIRFGATDDVGTRIPPAVLAEFKRTHPSVQVEVIVNGSRFLREQLEAGLLDLILVTAGESELASPTGTIVHTEELVWAHRENSAAVLQRPLPLALSAQGCVWRTLVMAALERAGIPYCKAYTIDHCSGQQAAMEADLAVAAFPVSLIEKPLQRASEESGLPSLGFYQIEMVSKAGSASDMDDTVQSLSEHIVRAFQSIRRQN